MPGRESAVKTLFRLIVLVLLLAGWGLAALSLHVVRTPETLTIVPKNRLGITDTVVDTRNWTLDDAVNHPDVVARLLDLDKTSLIAHLAGDRNEQEFERALRNAVKRGREEQTTAAAALIKRLHITI